MVPNRFLTCPGHGSGCLTTTWNCTIPSGLVCNGLSECLTDECSCPNTTVIYYPGGVGCVSVESACNFLPDCPGGEDERAWCENYWGKNTTTTASFEAQCHTRDLAQLNGRRCQELCPIKIGKHLQCADLMYFRRAKTTLDHVTMCKEACNVSSKFCENLVAGRMVVNSYFTVMYQCETVLDQVTIDMTCDGIFDCPDMTDETHCPDRFYCSKTDWLDGMDMVCDGHSDCENALDECSGCVGGSFSSDERIISSFSLMGLFALAVLTIFIANAYNLYEIEWRGVEEEHLQVDRLLKVALVFHDLIMGLYLVSLQTANLWYYGKYCKVDVEWRSGALCQTLGFLFTFSCHGSLLTVLLMSVTRAYKCGRPFSSGIPLCLVQGSLAVMFLVNLTNAALPLIPIEEIQRVFRSNFQMSSTNPFITTYNTDYSDIDRIYAIFFNDSSSRLNLYEKLEQLKTTTNKPSMYAVQDFSFYSWTPVCLPDMFSTKTGTLLLYKTGYLATIGVVLIIIITSYGFILRKVIASLRENSVSEIGTKVAIIVGVKLSTWLFVAGIMIYTMITERLVSSTWYDATAISILPLNSCLNPVFHSDLYKLVLCWWKKLNIFRSPKATVEIEMRENSLFRSRDWLSANQGPLLILHHLPIPASDPSPFCRTQGRFNYNTHCAFFRPISPAR
eukprot:sb/3462725/